RAATAGAAGRNRRGRARALSESEPVRRRREAAGRPFRRQPVPARAARGEPSGSLRLAVAARVRALTPAGRSAIASLALLGRPAERSLLGEGATEIVE